MLEIDESTLKLARAFPEDSKGDTPNFEFGGKKAKGHRNHRRGWPCSSRLPQKGR